MKVEFIRVVWWIIGLMQPPCLISKRTVRTAQYNDHVIRHVPHGCWDRHPMITRRRINTAIHITWQNTLSAYLSNNVVTIMRAPIQLQLSGYVHIFISPTDDGGARMILPVYQGILVWCPAGQDVFVLTKVPIPAVGPTHPSIKWVPRNSFLRGKVLGTWSWPLNSTYCCG
jgi:hypothetical protein